MNDDIRNWLQALHPPIETYAAMRAMKNLAQQRVLESVPMLIELLNDGDDWVKASAAEALGSLQDSRAVPALISILDYGLPEPELPKQFPPEVNPGHFALAVVTSLRELEDVRANAAKALLAIGTPKALAALKKTANNPIQSSRVRKLADRTR